MTPPRVPLAKIVIEASGEHQVNMESPPCPPESEVWFCRDESSANV
jgi:hypothetical protein